MIEWRTAYERTEPREDAGPVLCIPTVMRHGASSWRSWIDAGNGTPIQTGYLLDDHYALVIPAAMPKLRPHHFTGELVPWERVPESIREHVLHVIEGIEPS